jgi:hypothetical protein
MLSNRDRAAMSSRIDLYSLPHKSLRHALHEAGAVLGSGDAGPARTALELLASHGGHEEEFIHPLLDRHLPDLAETMRSQHRELDARLERVHVALDGTDPVAAYRRYHRLVAWNLGHLDEEETIVLPALWSAVPDAALADVFGAFRAAHPEANDLYRRWPEPLTVDERQLVLSD